jgi:methionyl-tRNA formyltransferase
MPDRDLPDVLDLQSGEAAFVAKKLLLGTAEGVVELEQVKPDGKKSMEGRAFAAGIQGIKKEKASWGRA